jgi:hypothetical protein
MTKILFDCGITVTIRDGFVQALSPTLTALFDALATTLPGYGSIPFIRVLKLFAAETAEIQRNGSLMRHPHMRLQMKADVGDRLRRSVTRYAKGIAAIEEMQREPIRLCSRFFCSIEQAFDAIMRGFDFVILMLDNLVHRRRQTFLQRVSVFFDG